MAALSREIVERFASLCDDAYASWLLRRGLFDDNEFLADADTTHVDYALEVLSRVTTEHVLLQIAKLHDPATQSGQANLGIDYLIRFGAWPEDVGAQLAKIREKLDSLNAQLRTARNKLLSHNDLETLLADVPLGSFRENHDREYFAALQSFLNVVHQATVGGPRPFFDTVQNDVRVLARRIVRRAEA